MQNSGKTITTHASLLPQGFPIFLHFNHVWVQGDNALNVKGQRVVCSLPLITFPLSVQKLKQKADQFQQRN